MTRQQLSELQVQASTHGETALIGVLLTLGILGILFSVLLIAPASAPVSATVAEGDSMDHDGERIILHADLDAEVGDTVILDTGSSLIHHRVVDETSAGLVTRGDAEPVSDQESIPPAPHGTEETILGVGLFTIPVPSTRGI